MNKIKLKNRLNSDISIESESEYFFDDQFSIPFDANLKEENNNISNELSLEINRNDFGKNISQLCQSFSESCIYSDLDSSYQAFPDILDDLLDRKMATKEVLFTPPQSGSEMEARDSMTRSSFTQSDQFLKDLLTKQLNRDYRITFEEKTNSNLNRKTFSLINCSNALNDNSDNNANKVTWNQMSSKNHNSLLKNQPKQPEDPSIIEGQSTTWRQLKDNASNKVISWNKLKTTTTTSTKTTEKASENLLKTAENRSDPNQRSRSATKTQYFPIDNSLPPPQMMESVKCRAHSEPRKSHRFSGTLLEIYSRTKGGLNQSKTTSQDWSEFGDNFINNRFNNIGNDKPEKSKTLINFGAQFPPTTASEFLPRPRSNSLLDKKPPQRYPGLGLIKTPKSTRLTHSAFLSKTLPDLSFLSKTSPSSNLAPTTTTADGCDSGKRGSNKTASGKDSGFDSGSSNNERLRESNQFCSKCQSIFFDPPVTDDLIKLDDKLEAQQFNHHQSVPNFQSVDLLTGSPRIVDKKPQQPELETPLKSCLRQSLDRSVSEPDFANSKNNNIKYNEFHTESASSSISDFESNKTNKAKKSVSFSEKIIKKPLSPIKYYGSSLSLWKNDLENSLKPQEIPRDWGLYGNGSVMISEFVLGAQMKMGGKENEISNEDMKYKAMVRDVINSVQETIAYCSEQSNLNKNLAETKSIKTPPLIVEPLYALLTDGILPYQKNIVSIKSRYRLWNIVEMSCNNAEYMNEIMKTVKKCPITNEKNRFKVFISHLINSRLLQRWFKDLVNNESLLKNNYSKESFLRQVNTNLKGQYADLDTNLQLLDSLPYGSLVRSKSSQTKEKLTTVKPTTSVKSLKKSNMNQLSSSSSNLSSKLQDLNKLKVNPQTDNEFKPTRPITPKSKNSNTSSNSSVSSTPSLKKPVIYYPKYSVGKGKI